MEQQRGGIQNAFYANGVFYASFVHVQFKYYINIQTCVFILSVVMSGTILTTFR